MAEKLSKWQLNVYYSKSCVRCNNKYRHCLTNTKGCWYQNLNKLNPSAEQACLSVVVVAIDVVVHARKTCCFLTHKQTSQLLHVHKETQADKWYNEKQSKFASETLIRI